MKSIMSLFSNGIFKSDLKRYWWISVLYTLLLFFTFPLRTFMLMDTIDQGYSKNNIIRLFDLTSHQSSIQMFLIFIVPVVVAILVFRYLHIKNAASVIHSLPLTRKQLFITHIVSGLLLLTVPILVNSLILVIFNLTTDLGLVFSFIDIFTWTGYSLMIILLIFSFATFVGMFTANTIAHLVFNYILHILPLGLFALLQVNLPRILHGYSSYNPLQNDPAFLEKLPFSLIGSSIELSELILIYPFFSLLFLFIAYYAYKLRHIEIAGDVISFKVITPVFKYGVSICSMLLGGAYFASISDDTPVMILIGYIIASLIGYFIAEMSIQKTYKVFSSFKGYLVYIIIILIVFTGIQADVIGYSSHIPDSDEIEYIYFSRGFSYLHDVEQGEMDPSEAEGFFTEKENIKNIKKLHEELIEQGSTNSGSQFFIIYRLENEEYVVRQYQIDEDKYNSKLKPIFESPEYKEGKFPILRKNSNQIENIDLKDERVLEDKKTFSDKESIEKIHSLLKTDIKNLSYENIFSRNRNYLVASVKSKDGSSNRYVIKKDYQLLNWLKENNYYKDFALTPEKINYITIEKTDSRIGREKDSKKAKITDNSLIQEVLTLSGYREDLTQAEHFSMEVYFKDTTPYFRDQLHLDKAKLENLSDDLQKIMQFD
ncbi:DUF6449 domain-containing protein [Natranaerobius trueperi]|uniref:DUF6449 domain-containing protein n=1 Tax=Natranaerobius trueperi TaxID=759412 RepID=A0A226C3J1_9FIRM|nr:DUF6449 domain-containing protein [Natranaerobius trueperi]OWZ84997.1 hypothetical protein CDO51_00945 [Natranaerobius trueperi]